MPLYRVGLADGSVQPTGLVQGHHKRREEMGTVKRDEGGDGYRQKIRGRRIEVAHPERDEGGTMGGVGSSFIGPPSDWPKIMSCSVPALWSMDQSSGPGMPLCIWARLA